MATTAFHVHPEQFAKCSPNIQTNIRHAGTVTVCNGTSSGTTFDSKVTVKSLTNIPIDENSFPVGGNNVAGSTAAGDRSRGLRVFLHGATGGGATIETQFEVASVTDNGDGTATLE